MPRRGVFAVRLPFPLGRRPNISGVRRSRLLRMVVVTDFKSVKFRSVAGSGDPRRLAAAWFAIRTDSKSIGPYCAWICRTGRIWGILRVSYSSVRQTILPRVRR